ncbi:MAG: DEAD/DEAH box helicase [Actinobacteria bacterium]|nr:DEAD/DEAH box helicase [Actinomycetota bacterium]
MTSVLTTHGYAVVKADISKDLEAKIRKELTVKPQSQQSRYNAMADTEFPVFLESATRLYLPRVWAKDTLGPAASSVMSDGLPLPENLKFIGSPYEYQEQIISKFLAADANGLICVPCGKGKTFMAVAIAFRLRRRFMVVVDKEFLLDQWAGEMRNLIPGIRIGRFQANKAEVDPAEFDCTICMIQTIVQRQIPESVLRSYAFTIFDECHHLGAKHFSKVLSKLQTKHMLGLSATPTRDDGLTKVFEWHLGKPVYWEKRREADETVNVEIMRFSCEDPDYTEVPTNFRGEVILARLLTQIVNCQKRNLFIADKLKELIKEPGRRILVLSERIGHLEALEALIKPTGCVMGYYIGGMKTATRDLAAEEAQVLWATYAMASEAMNIKTLNTVLMASPRKKIEQSTGRILRQRPEERKVAPIILDVVDIHRSMQSQSRQRIAYYRKCGYKIKDGESEDSDVEVVETLAQKCKRVDGKQVDCEIVDDD